MIQVPVCELLKGSEGTDNIDATNSPGDKRGRGEQRAGNGGWALSRRANSQQHWPASRISDPTASGLEQFQNIQNPIFTLPEPMI